MLYRDAAFAITIKVR